MRRAIVCGLVVAAVLVLPATAPASVTLGKADLSATSGVAWPCQTSSGDCTSFHTGVRAGGLLTAPADGVIVRWRLKLGAAGPKVALRVVHVASGQVTAVRADSPVDTMLGLNEWSSHLPISAGDTIGYDDPSSSGGPNVAVMYTGAAGASMAQLSPKLGPTETRSTGTSFGIELFFNADVEPDADHDGFGDETQDSCPANPASSQSPCTKPEALRDTTVPGLLGDPSAKPSTFAVDPKGTVEAPVKTSAKKGTIFTYVLSEPATVTFKIERQSKGRKAKGKCVKRNKRNAKQRACTLYKTVGAFRHQGIQGENSRPFSGRIGNVALRPAKYRGTLSAIDAAGNASKTKAVAFKVVNARRK